MNEPRPDEIQPQPGEVLVRPDGRYSVAFDHDIGQAMSLCDAQIKTQASWMNITNMDDKAWQFIQVTISTPRAMAGYGVVDAQGVLVLSTIDHKPERSRHAMEIMSGMKWDDLMASGGYRCLPVMVIPQGGMPDIVIRKSIIQEPPGGH